MAREVLAYGRATIIQLAVLDAEGSPAGLVLENAMTFAAGDVKLFSNKQAPTNLTAEFVAFTSGSVEPSPGDVISGATSTETATIIDVIVTSGSWGGGDAAGFIFAEGVSGVFQSENLDNDTTGQANFATIGADFTGGIGVVVASKSIIVAITSAEAACRWGQFEIVDATATEVWLETTLGFVTIGHPKSNFPGEGGDGVLVEGVVGADVTSTSVLHLVDENGIDLSTAGDDEYNDYLVMVKDVSGNKWVSRWIDDWDQSDAHATLNAALPFTPEPGVDLYKVLAVRKDPAVARVEIDTQNIQSRIPDALTGDGNIKADALAWNGTATNGDGSVGDKARVGA